MPPKSLPLVESLRATWPWLPLWLALALLAIFAHGPMPMYSTRTLAVAWEMWSGHHWIVPTFNGAPYSDKAPLLFWLIHLGWFAFGVGDTWPRVLEVAFGGAELVLAATLARRLFPDRPWVARLTPWMLAGLAYGFLFGQQIMYEVLLANCVLASLLCLTPTAHRDAPRWIGFAILIGAGLLTKGPVMLLHVAFPWLLGPLWNDYARRERARWYGYGALAMLGGLALLAAWLVPAIHIGGPAYMQQVLFKQTGGRVVHAFAHAEPFWWYLPWLPVLLFPFAAWPRAWAALILLRRPLDPGLRFLLAWLLPVLLGFSLVSGKQLYYLLPEYGGMVMLLASAVAVLRERRPQLAATPWLGPWPLAVGGLLIGAFLLALPSLAGHGILASHWAVDLAGYSRYFAIVYLLLGVLMLLRGRGEVRRMAVGGLVGAFAFSAWFTLTLWPSFDLKPTADLLARAQSQGHAVASVGYPEGQFMFAARLRQPVAALHNRHDIEAFARRHPHGLIVTYPANKALHAPDLRYALLVQPFRNDWLVVWRADTLAAYRAGRTPPEPDTPTRLLPSPDYWRYRPVQG